MAKILVRRTAMPDCSQLSVTWVRWVSPRETKGVYTQLIAPADIGVPISNLAPKPRFFPLTLESPYLLLIPFWIQYKVNLLLHLSWRCTRVSRITPNPAELRAVPRLFWHRPPGAPSDQALLYGGSVLLRCSSKFAKLLRILPMSPADCRCF